MSRYFEAMRTAIESHGGSVEKFIGDAVMAVFGIPVVHEDDALRACVRPPTCSALVELNEELERDWGVRIESRIGVNTGEVVAGEGDSLATGDAVNVAARLEQGAAPGETLLGEPLSDSCATRSRPSRSSCSSRRASRSRFGHSASSGSSRARSSSHVISTRRSSDARTSLPSCSAPSTTRFPTASPTSSRCSAPPASATVSGQRAVRPCRCDAAAGWCPPYGDGITYWPLVEIEQLASEIDFDTNRDEIALQTRRILERLAHEKPLVLVFDDLQWGEPTFLDLVDHVTDLARDALDSPGCVWTGSARRQARLGRWQAQRNDDVARRTTEDESAQLVDNVLSSSWTST